MFLTLPLTRVTLAILCALVSLCGSAVAQPPASTAKSIPQSAVLATLPADAKEVAATVASAKVGEKVAIRGRIAMAKDAFNADKAVFTLTDDAAATGCCPKDGALLDSCKLGGDTKAIIRLVDSSGQPRLGGLSGASGLKHGAEVFVVGTVSSTNNKDALSVDASGIHVPAVGVPLGLMTTKSSADAKDVSDVKKAGALKKGDKVVLRGLIGGSKTPFVGGRAMFTLVGGAIKPCNAKADDHCKTPWDYCCDPKSAITANSATIRVVDAQGNPLKLDLKGRAGIKELSDVVVEGTVAMAEKGTLIVDATSLRVVTP